MQGNNLINHAQHSNLPEVRTTGQRILEEECPPSWRTAGQF